jgi:hypothetical protein
MRYFEEYNLHNTKLILKNHIQEVLEKLHFIFIKNNLKNRFQVSKRIPR